jgi:glycosyltransferase involved in cell wall biosynthesis
MIFSGADPSPSVAAPRLSICIPTYNRAEILAETLAHLNAVCGDDVEIAVSDNHSPDHTQGVIERFAPRFRHFRSVCQSVNRGSIPNFGAAIQLATGRYVYLLGDDDQIYIDGLRAAMDIMDREGEVVAVYGAHQEWIRKTGYLTPPIKLAEERLDFARGDKLGVFNKFGLLWLPVCRREIIQRFHTYDAKTFGFWELVGCLLEHGGITMIPDLFYRHAHTEPRQEFELTENWYHDQHRAQYESFIGRIGPQEPAEAAHLINLRAAPAYAQGLRFAKLKREFLTMRHFILRSRAYGLIPEPDVATWERQALVGMVAERLLHHVGLIPGLRRVFFEDSPKLLGLRTQFTSIAPAYSVGQISQPQWTAAGLPPDSYLVTLTWAAPGWEKATELGAARCRAAMDLVESCRITDQPLSL